MEASNDETHLVLSVTNEGEPIEPHLPGGGLGLGLYICKQIVEGHSGTLEVLSTTNEGTRFTARIPLTLAANSLMFRVAPTVKFDPLCLFRLFTLRRTWVGVAAIGTYQPVNHQLQRTG